MLTYYQANGCVSELARGGTTLSTTLWVRIFPRAGKRLTEQIELLRRYWENLFFSFEGEFDQLDRGNINLRPNRQIPIWLGGFSEVAFRRAGKIGDGFMFAGDFERCNERRTRVEHYLKENGRSPDDFGFELIALRGRTPAEAADAMKRWED